MMNEQPILERPVPGYPDYVVRPDGTVYNTKHKRIVKGRHDGIIKLYDATGCPKQLTLAHVILETFGRRRPFPTCRIVFRDKNPANLAPDNLYWAVGTGLRCGQCQKPIDVKDFKAANKLHPTLCWACCSMTKTGRVPNVQKTWPCPLCAESNNESEVE